MLGDKDKSKPDKEVSACPMLGRSCSCFQTVGGLRTGLRLKITAMTPESHRKPKNPRILCLHGFRTSGRILRAIITDKWPDTILRNLDLDFLDAPFPATGKSDVERLFDPPYYEWYQAKKGFKEYRNFEECLAYIEDYMIKNGPFDGLLGFSQGAFLTAALPGMQEQGTALTKVPKVKFLVIISGAKIPGLIFGVPKAAVNAFSSPVRCPSLHFIGERDFLKTAGEALIQSFVEPVVIRHQSAHTIPKLDTKAKETVLSFFQRIRQILSDDSGPVRSLM
ncbi:PREDICTED: LOW QUALITY PROTEIN: esterase C25G4.2-like [Camelina sativa]|uniref:LOW QUALITY PROTEIN: esterase C25G4.2-like n=1 Tax=Camelina sativa TaxID=90675 RepID=A0ABM0VYL2_CAMSA|nr:PREDICTED: LOW QUALITY PROTEIN: esterase C25G4.2-like [Camelina sativa]